MDIVKIAAQIAPANAGLLQLLGFINDDPNAEDLRHIAYMLATVQHETGNKFMPIYENGPIKYFDQYDAGTRKGERLGNDVKGDGYLYRGRGYCQITGKANYARFSKILDIDLVTNPDLALEPANAYKIMAIGMHCGIFTGKTLGNYFNDNVTDWLSARRIINRLDCADKIATTAKKYFSILKQTI